MASTYKEEIVHPSKTWSMDMHSQPTCINSMVLCLDLDYLRPLCAVRTTPSVERFSPMQRTCPSLSAVMAGT